MSKFLLACFNEWREGEQHKNTDEHQEKEDTT